MHKKKFIKNRPFDINDATDFQTWTEDALKTTMKTIYSSGVVTGLQVAINTGMSLYVTAGYGFDINFNVITIPTQTSITLQAADATNPRIDLVVIKNKKTTVNNTDTTNKYGMGTSYVYSQNELDDFQIDVIKGTPAATPAVPAQPAGTIKLASVLVGKGVTSITSLNITDLRQYVTINQNINKLEVVFSKTAPTDTSVLWIDTN